MEYFFPQGVGEGEPDVTAANVVVEFANGAYWPVLRAWIEAELARPFPVGDQMAMIQAGIRSNVFRELKNKIERDIKESVSIIERSGRV